MTGHAHHFLSRLDRTTAAETELALSLYRDPSLLRAVIDVVRPDPSFERVAIALGGDDGSHLIVTRDARFVTCLERGMKVYDAARVSRDDLDHCATIIGRLRITMGRANEAVHDRGQVRAAFGSLFADGDRMTREHMELVLELQPLMFPEFLGSYSRAFQRTEDALATLSRRDRFRRDEHPRLHALWQGMWASSHLMTLLASDTFALSYRYSDDARTIEDCLAAVCFAGARLGLTSSTLRGVWAAARMAHACIDALESLALSAELSLARLGAIWTLAAAGVQHPGLVERATRCLEAVAATSKGFAAHLAPVALGAMRERLDGGDAWERATTELLRGGTYSNGLRDSWDGFDDDAVLAWHASLEYGLRDDEAPTLLSRLVPWFATRGAGAMCQRAEVARRLQPRWDVGLSESLLESYRALWLPLTPERATPVPGRNDPCVCGSARKYKKCCG